MIDCVIILEIARFDEEKKNENTPPKNRGIGYRRTSVQQTFTNHKISFKEGDSFYLFTDGIPDQIGGLKRRGFGKKRLKSVLMDYHRMEMKQQAIHLQQAFEEHQYKETQRDDITVVAFKPNSEIFSPEI